MASLTKLLDNLGLRKIVVVADRYPPSNFGGAEVSLHVFLSHLEDKSAVLVVAFEEELKAPRTYSIDGVDVLALPWQAPWPYVHRTRPEHRFKERLARLFRQSARTKRRMIRESAAVEPAARQLLLKAEILKPRGGVVADFAEYQDGLAIRMLREVFRATGAQLLHADNYRSIAWTVKASEGLLLKRVGTVRDNRFHCVRYSQSVRTERGECESCDISCAKEDLKKEEGLQRELLRKTQTFRLSCLAALDRIVVTSCYLEAKVSGLVEPSKVSRIANAVDSIDQAEATMHGVAELPGMNLLVVGMINENKGQLDLVRHLSALVEAEPRIRLHVVGRGERLQKRIQEVAEEANLLHHIVFRGFVERDTIYRVYRECQIIVCPTIWPEPFGRVPLEAGLTRRPVVSFAVGGLKESIVQGETGYLVEPGDWEGFHEAVLSLARDPDERFRMGQAAFEHVTRTYEVGVLSAKLRELWGETLSLG
jgi:glycosyltransferase involved in cell wall biosynthesis